MRTIAVTAVIGAVVGMMMLAPACSSDDKSSTAASTTTTTGTSAGGSGGATTSTTGSGGGGSSGCVEVTALTGFKAGDGQLSGNVTPNIFGMDPDSAGILVPPMTTGTVTFKPIIDAQVCGATEVCAVVQTDVTETATGALFLAKSGKLELTAFDGGFYATGSLTDVTFEEVTVDDATAAVTPVVGGKCVHFAKFAFDIKAPISGWSCDPSYFDETKAGASEIFCDCGCGAVDPDCASAANKIDGCFAGQTCGTKATCEGVPTKWTCMPDQFNGGVGNGCDCGCGVPDPDCDLMPAEAVEGCSAGASCSAGKCIPMGWKCDPSFYDEDEPGVTAKVCDCGCGIADPDCAAATLASCDFCKDEGSCSTKECKGNLEINATNNAICN